MRIKVYLTGLIVAVMALSSPIAFADNGGNFAGGGDANKGEHAWHHQGKHHLMARVLNLTEDQQKQLNGIKKKQREDMKSAFEQIKSNRAAFTEEITKAAPDMNKVNELQAQLKTIQAQMADNHLNNILAVKKIMTPEQFAGFMALKKAKKMMEHEHHKFCPKCGMHKMGGEPKDGDNKGHEQRPEDKE